MEEVTIIIRNHNGTHVLNISVSNLCIHTEPSVDNVFNRLLGVEDNYRADIKFEDAIIKELTTADIDELINTLVMIREDKLAKIGG